MPITIRQVANYYSPAPEYGFQCQLSQLTLDSSYMLGVVTQTNDSMTPGTMATPFYFGQLTAGSQPSSVIGTMKTSIVSDAYPVYGNNLLEGSFNEPYFFWVTLYELEGVDKAITATIGSFYSESIVESFSMGIPINAAQISAGGIVVAAAASTDQFGTGTAFYPTQGEVKQLDASAAPPGYSGLAMHRIDAAGSASPRLTGANCGSNYVAACSVWLTAKAAPVAGGASSTFYGSD